MPATSLFDVFSLEFWRGTFFGRTDALRWPDVFVFVRRWGQVLRIPMSVGPANDHDGVRAKARLTLLALAWGVTGLMHHLTFERLGFGSVMGAVYLVATLALVARPASLRRFGFFLLTTVVVLASEYEELSNHLVYEFWLAVALLAGVSVRAWSDRGLPFSPARLYHGLAPLLRGSFLLLYGFAFWSKLNSGFLSPDASCAAWFVELSLRDYGFDAVPGLTALGETKVLQTLAIALTLGLELGVPLLLIGRRSREIGVMLALGFHFAMGLVPILGISSFSSLAFVCLLPWIPARAFDRFHAAALPLLAWLERRDAPVLLTKLSLIIGVVLAIAVGYRYFHPAPHFVTSFWLLVSLPSVWLAGRAVWTERRARVLSGSNYLATDNDDGGLVPRPRGLLAALTPIVLLGISPYFGFGTQGTFTMFSNLRLHGDAPNHYLARPSWFVRETELVQILSTNHPVFAPYREGSPLLTDHEFRRRAARITTDFFVIGLYRGERFMVGRRRGVLDDHPLSVTLSWPERVLLRHRDVPTSEPCECQW